MGKLNKIVSNIIAKSSIFVFFIMAFEVAIMISPFAFFFYSVFNPIFNWLGQYTATKWLTSFFLPHMILPPTLFLKTIRIAGSVLFIIGFLSFFICALQVYLGKIFKWGIADKGLYKYIRHPQYLSLGVWGIGMAILWPRFIVLATLSIMFVLYYYLAFDEERRMKNLYGESYRVYMNRTGRFFPKFIEKNFKPINNLIPKSSLQYAIIPLIVVAFVMLPGFTLYNITLSSIGFTSNNNISLLSMLPENPAISGKIISGILKNQESGKLTLIDNSKDYLGYIMPADYVMQGMIANTGDDFHLFKQHHTFTMITEWVLHPFQHLTASPAFHMAKMHNVDPSFARRHHCPIGIDDPSLTCDSCPYRRVIMIEVDHNNQVRLSGKNLLAVNTIKIPVFFFDMDTTSGKIVNLKKVEKATAWKDVPTPTI